MVTKTEQKALENKDRLIENLQVDIDAMLKAQHIASIIDLVTEVSNKRYMANDKADYEIWYDQWSRSITSVGANIIEGEGRHSEAERIRFYAIAWGSAVEACYWAELSCIEVVYKETRRCVEDARRHMQSCCYSPHILTAT